MDRTAKKHVTAKVMRALLERFGEPLDEAFSDGQGVPSSAKKKDMGNRGFGARFDETSSAMPTTCQQCGGMMGLDEDTCNSCGMMPYSARDVGMDESEGGGRHPGHSSSCTCPDCSRPKGEKVLADDGLDEATPPGKERVVKALKKQKGVRNPWAVAWSQYDREHGK